MEMEFWDEIEGIGKLYVEEELVVGIEPVLQVCVDVSRNTRYLVMTYDSGEGEYVFCRIDRKALIDMLNNKRTMEETFRAAGKIYATSPAANGLLQASAKPAHEFPADMLPDKGAYYDISSEYIRKYVEKLKNYQDVNDWLQTEIYNLIENICLNLSNPVRKEIGYDSDFHKEEEYKMDDLDVCNNKYSANSSMYFAA